MHVPPFPRLATRAAIALAAACLPMMPGTASAAVARPMDLPELAAASDLVVRAVVQSSSPRRLPGGRFVTDHAVRIEETLAGQPGGDLAVVTTLGGEMDGEGQAVPGSPVLARDSEVVLFLRRPGPASPMARCSVVGLAQGAFRLDRTAGRARLVRRLDGLALPDPSIPSLPGDLDRLREALQALPLRGGTP